MCLLVRVFGLQSNRNKCTCSCPAARRASNLERLPLISCTLPVVGTRSLSDSRSGRETNVKPNFSAGRKLVNVRMNGYICVFDRIILMFMDIHNCMFAFTCAHEIK